MQYLTKKHTFNLSLLSQWNISIIVILNYFYFWHRLFRQCDVPVRGNFEEDCSSSANQLFVEAFFFNFAIKLFQIPISFNQGHYTLLLSFLECNLESEKSVH